jgi:signal transduction histidine kinase
LIGFIGIVTSIFSLIAFVASYKIFDGNVSRNTDYLTSKKMCEDIKESLLIEQANAIRSYNRNNLDLTNNKIYMVDYDDYMNDKNKVSEYKFLDIFTGLSSEDINDYFRVVIGNDDVNYSYYPYAVNEFIQMSFSDFDKALSKASFPFSWDEYSDIENDGDASNVKDYKEYSATMKGKAYAALKAAVDSEYISGAFNDGDYVVYDGENLLIYSPANGYIYQNNRFYKNGGVLYVSDVDENTSIYVSYPEENSYKGEIDKCKYIATSHIYMNPEELCIASLDFDIRELFIREEIYNNRYYVFSTGASFDGVKAVSFSLNSLEFGAFPYIDKDDKDDSSISYKKSLEKLKDCSDIFISYDANTEKLEQWYLDSTGKKVGFEYIDKHFLEDLKTEVDNSFFLTFSLEDSFYDSIYSSLYDVCKMIPNPSLVAAIGFIIFLVAVILITIGEPPVIRTIDRLPVAVGLALVIAAISCVYHLSWTLYNRVTGFNEYITNEKYGFLGIVVLVIAVIYIICAAIYLSVTRRIKCRKFLEGFISYRFLKWLYINVFGKLKGRTRLTITVVLFLLVNAVCIPAIWYTGRSYNGLIFVALMALTDLYVAYRLVKCMTDSELILSATKRIENGELDAKVDTHKLSFNNLELGESVNSLGSGLSNAIESSVRDERTKAELITNVSHDIKTPLTSIINYVDLLKRENIDNPKALEYINVIDKKSERLKQLILDLIEASKTSTGNIELERTNMNLVELMGQVAGEYEDKFLEKNLELIQNISAERVVINADGRRIFRIIDNVMNNIYKYALQGSRVYLDMTVDPDTLLIDDEATGASEDEGDSGDNTRYVKLAFKNVSSKMLNISPEELVERFVRGDESRSTEGSGLGLSIAKNLTELHGGTFDIEIDGDLFKVNITFPVV